MLWAMTVFVTPNIAIKAAPDTRTWQRLEVPWMS